jgi:ribosomal-protein-serine acetyltransferase
VQSIVVSTELLLERIALRDASTIFHAIDQNRDHLGRWLPFVRYTNEIKDSETFIGNVIRHRDETLNEQYTIWYKGDFAGIIGFHNTDRVNEKCEMGYWLISKMKGKGIITQSCTILTRLAFEKMGMNRITIRSAIGNEASEKIAKKLGFKYEGIERNGERFEDQFLDLKVWSLLKNESLFE